jgi:hypothetical protein
MWTDLARYAATLGDDYDRSEAYGRHQATTDAVWVLGWHAVRGMRDILNPIQQSMLPGWAGTLNRMEKPGNPRTVR